MENETFKATLRGTSPLIMHNGLLADPDNKFSQELAKVAKGKAKDLLKASRIEWMGSLYLNEQGEPCLPVDVVLSALVDGAKAHKMGKQVKAGVYDIIGTDSFALQYTGPRDIDKLAELAEFRDRRGVRVQMSRVMRTRPIFRKWAIDIELEFDPSLISRDELLTALTRTGKAVGMGDYRPRFGRFIVENFK